MNKQSNQMFRNIMNSFSHMISINDRCEVAILDEIERIKNKIPATINLSGCCGQTSKKVKLVNPNADEGL